ncbi:MAG TPA: glycosyltransferase [Chitinophagaceae bacterium]|nr:glycosyltransferase [Chitinophagaceae bacterium]
MSRKKILWLCSWFPGKTEPYNGDFIQRHARAASLYNDIYVIHVIGDASGTIRQIEKEITKSDGLTEHLVYFKKKPGLIGKFKAHSSYLFLFKQAIRRYVLENGKPDLVHVHIPYKAGLLGIWLKKRYKIPFIVSEHWGIYNKIVNDNYEKQNFFFKRIVSKTFHEANCWVSVSNYLSDGVKKMVFDGGFKIIPNTVDTGLFYFKLKDQGKFRFIHVSNMVTLKNAEGILRAFKSFCKNNSSAELVMVGDNRKDIREFAAKLFSEGKVKFRGEIPYQQVAKEMQDSNCLILFSDIENSPCVIGEALCCGVPVIATNVGGIPELVNEENGLLVEPGDEEGLASVMGKMIEQYSSFDRKKITNAATAKFSYQKIGKEFDLLYQKETITL